MCTVTHKMITYLKIETHSVKCIARQFYCCANMMVCTYTIPEGIIPGLCDTIASRPQTRLADYCTKYCSTL